MTKRQNDHLFDLRCRHALWMAASAIQWLSDVHPDDRLTLNSAYRNLTTALRNVEAAINDASIGTEDAKST